MSNQMFINTMPRDDEGGGQYAALWDGAFETIDPDTGLPYPLTSGGGREPHAPPEYFHIGWGTYDRPAGFSPGMKASATAEQLPTGKLVDGATWDFNFAGQNSEFPPTGRTADGNPISINGVMGCVAIYAQIPDWFTNTQKNNYDWVYFVGRFYRDYTVGS
jgi:hypothetical protein